MNKKVTVDLSTELAEGFVLPPAGIPTEVLQQTVIPETGVGFHPRHTMDRADDVLLPIITSAYLACGLHSGDPLVLRRLIPTLLENEIQIGAHPSYPGLFNFGQDRIEMSQEELVSVFLYQFGALDGVLREFGQRIRTVKCHGTLYFDVTEKEWACAAMIQAILAFDPEVIVIAPAVSGTLDQVKASGLRVTAECYVDRRYGANGRIVDRSHPRATLESAERAVAQVLGVVRDGTVETVDGTMIPMAADTFCLHSDTPGADAMGKAVAAALNGEDIEIKPTTGLF
tara:strand:- start:249 stop:1103 length:855 start_codon:yes stop_codon:yes gene_type:complete